jgi:hypothetical protein
MTATSKKLGAGFAALALFIAACGGSDEPAAPAPAPAPAPEAPVDEVEPGWPRPPLYTNPSLPTLDIVYERDRFTILHHTLPALDRFWSVVFDDVNIYYIDDPVAALVSGAAWIVQSEPGVVWPALEQGVVDGVIVGVTNDVEEWIMMCDSSITGPQDLVGARITGGTIGDSWITVGKIILRDKFGLDPNSADWISVGGGSDGRMNAMLAGEVNCFMGQPRNLQPVLDAGGSAVFMERVENAQTQFIVTRQTWDNHRDAVCAAMEGHLETVLWLLDYKEERAADKWPEIAPYFDKYGYDSSDGARLWNASYPGTFSFDLGSRIEGLDTQAEIHASADDAALSADFDWRDYADFSCLWELQAAYGLPLRPDPSRM